MVINNPKYENHVKFVSYTGKYPCLCVGILTLEIDGEICTFGGGHGEPKAMYDSFWSSGGSITSDKDWNFKVEHDEWVINADDLCLKYRQYAEEIDEVFNANVPYGCCGGCI